VVSLESTTDRKMCCLTGRHCFEEKCQIGWDHKKHWCLLREALYDFVCLQKRQLSGEPSIDTTLPATGKMAGLEEWLTKETVDMRREEPCPGFIAGDDGERLATCGASGTYTDCEQCQLAGEQPKGDPA